MENLKQPNYYSKSIEAKYLNSTRKNRFKNRE